MKRLPRKAIVRQTMSNIPKDFIPDCLYSVTNRLEHEDLSQLRQVNKFMNQNLNNRYTSDGRMSAEQKRQMQEQTVNTDLDSIRRRHRAARTEERRIAEFETTKNLFRQNYMIKAVAENITDFICEQGVLTEFHKYLRTPEANLNQLLPCCTESSFVRSLVLAMRYHVNSVDLQQKGLRILDSIRFRVPMLPCHVLYESMAGIILATGADTNIICQIILYMSDVEQYKPAAYVVPVSVRSKFITVILECIERFRFKGIMSPQLYDFRIMNAGISLIQNTISSADYGEIITTRMLHYLHISLTEKNMDPAAENAQWSAMSDELPQKITLMLKKAQSNYSTSKNTDHLMPIRLFIKSGILYSLKYKSDMRHIGLCQEKLMEEVQIYTCLVEYGYRTDINFKHIVKKASNILQPVVTMLYGPNQNAHLVYLMRNLLVETTRKVNDIYFITAANKDLQTLFGQNMFITLAMNKIGMYTQRRTKSSSDKYFTDIIFEWTVFLGALLYKHKENQQLFINAEGMQTMFSIALLSCDFIQIELMTVLCTVLRDNGVAVHHECPFFVTRPADAFWEYNTATTFAKTMLRIASTNFPPPIDTTVLLQVYKTYQECTPYIKF